MISKTIGFRGLAYFQTHPYSLRRVQIWVEVPVGSKDRRSEIGPTVQLFFLEVRHQHRGKTQVLSVPCLFACIACGLVADVSSPCRLEVLVVVKCVVNGQ